VWLWLLVPRRGRGAGLGGLSRPARTRAALAALALLLVAAIVVVAARSGEDGRGAASVPAAPVVPATTAVPPAPATAPHAPTPARPKRPGLDIGLSELNPHLLWSTEARPQAPPGFGPWRDRVQAMQPDYYRLFVYWAGLQPDPSQPVNLGGPGDGCQRGQPPCAAFAGIREALEAIASQQRAGRGFKVVMVIFGVPDWAAAPARGCERSTVQPSNRAISDRGLLGYRRLVRDLLALARSKGVSLRYWSPWNEPNHPTFISPQRAVCDAHAPPLSPHVYARITRALQAELARDPDRHDLVLGELAGFPRPRPKGVSIKQFVRGLPDDVACSGTVWAQHQYARPDDPPKAKGVVGQLERVLNERTCTRRAHIWVTETGTGAARSGRERSHEPAALRRGCRAMAAALQRWAKDPRVDAAFQYTYREDEAFPVGLADQGLTRSYPTYGLWLDLGRDRGVNPARCRASATADGRR
jgi:hypothetical protein